ncbi:hypothetical protein Mal52_45650 [Symmachiella dynata]|uniref:Uncharacterized protein n=1 Tax=Symmachiella dynata TaxID=2527995 RepID=A0A517ZUA6_9PLAN|nr:hypothetical protein Mal52_45650 [Symmachiella dynata]
MHFAGRSQSGAKLLLSRNGTLGVNCKIIRSNHANSCPRLSVTPAQRSQQHDPPPTPATNGSEPCPTERKLEPAGGRHRPPPAACCLEMPTSLPWGRKACRFRFAHWGKARTRVGDNAGHSPVVINNPLGVGQRSVGESRTLIRTGYCRWHWVIVAMFGWGIPNVSSCDGLRRSVVVLRSCCRASFWGSRLFPARLRHWN